MKRTLIRLYLIIFFSAFCFVSYIHAQELTINTKDKTIEFTNGDKVLIRIDSICFNFHSPDRMELISRDERSALVQLTYLHVSEDDSSNVYKDREVRIKLTSNGATWHIEADASWAGNFSVHLADLNDHYYGVQEKNYPDNQLSPDLRGNTVNVAVDGENYRYSENFASAWSAFFFDNMGYASFFDTFSEGEYKFACQGSTELTHFTSGLDWYLFFGKDGNHILESYYRVIGKPKYIPVWACGPIVWRDDAKGGKDQVLNDVKSYTNLHIPITGLMIDRPYSDGSNEWSKMNFNRKFAHPEQWIKTLNDEYNINLLTWVAPMTFSDRDFPGLIPGHLDYMDLTNPDAVREFGNRLKTGQYEFGVKGHKMDRADEYFPHFEPWYDNSSYWLHKNKYIWLYAKTVDSFLTNSWGRDQFNFARAGFHRCQPYLSAIWGGDARSNWDGLAGNLANAVRTSFMGFPDWGSDVGGYLGKTGTIPDDLYIRWLQWGVWTGLFEIKYDGAGGNGTDRAPWHCSAKVLNAFKKSCDERMELIPYIYSALNTASVNGTLMKPLVMMYPDDTATYQMWDEYLFSNDFLVAPVTSPVTQRDVYFPHGNWISYNNPEKRIHGGRTLPVKCSLDQIPVYVKDGAVFVTGNMKTGNNTKWVREETSFVLNAFISKNTTSSSYDFVDMYDSDKIKHIQMDTGAEGTIIHSDPFSRDIAIRVFMPETSFHLILNGNEIPVKYQNGRLKDIQVKKGEVINLAVTF